MNSDAYPLHDHSFEDFEKEALAAGFDKALVRQWPPGKTLETHAHPFDSQAVVTQGEMWLTVAGQTRHLLPGDAFTLSHGESHEERYGVEGATYWVARRDAA